MGEAENFSRSNLIVPRHLFLLELALDDILFCNDYAIHNNVIAENLDLSFLFPCIYYYNTCDISYT